MRNYLFNTLLLLMNWCFVGQCDLQNLYVQRPTFKEYTEISDLHKAESLGFCKNKVTPQRKESFSKTFFRKKRCLNFVWIKQCAFINSSRDNELCKISLSSPLLFSLEIVKQKDFKSLVLLVYLVLIFNKLVPRGRGGH